MNIEVLSVLVAIVLAFMGYIATYWNNVQMARKAAQLELLNKRIGEFYGPLYIATSTGKQSYSSLLKKLNRKAIFTDKENPPTAEDVAEWRAWVENVFMPANELVEKLIIEKAHLIQEEEMPSCLLQYITHISGYKVVLEKWKKGDFSEQVSIIDYPVELNAYATESYKKLKAKQLELIGKFDTTTVSSLQNP